MIAIIALGLKKNWIIVLMNLLNNMSHKSSSGEGKHPYLKLSFWIDNQFWQSPLYGEKSKRYYNRWLKKWINEGTSLTELTKIKHE